MCSTPTSLTHSSPVSVLRDASAIWECEKQTVAATQRHYTTVSAAFCNSSKYVWDPAIDVQTWDWTSDGMLYLWLWLPRNQLPWHDFTASWVWCVNDRQWHHTEKQNDWNEWLLSRSVWKKEKPTFEYRTSCQRSLPETVPAAFCLRDRLQVTLHTQAANSSRYSPEVNPKTFYHSDCCSE